MNSHRVLPAKLGVFFRFKTACIGLATMLGLLSALGSQAAVHINPRGLGEVLLFPYYTTVGKYDTYINLVNTRDEAKALKVRFRESMNGAVVLEMNLYLAPLDHWSAVLYPKADGPGVELRSVDKSCTVPIAISAGETITLSNENYQSDSNAELERTHEGFVEVIEMAVIGAGSMDWPSKITHTSSGSPGDCEGLESAWAAGGAWRQNPLDGSSTATGGIYGYGVLIDVQEGTEAAYDAVAIANFTAADASALHSSPESTMPSLASGDTQYQILADGNIISSSAESGIDAVSAVLMQAGVINDYVLEPSIAASTDWVITFPTKTEYVNEGAARAPFTAQWDSAESAACEGFTFDYADREIGNPASEPPGLPFPLQPPFVPLILELCAQANVFAFNAGFSGSGVLEADFERNAYLFNLQDGFDNGWATMGFDLDRPALVAGSLAFRGLPFIGFSLQKYVNGTVFFEGDFVLSNYVGVVKHKGHVIFDSP